MSSAINSISDQSLFHSCFWLTVKCVVLAIIGWLLNWIISIVLLFIYGPETAIHYYQQLLQRQLGFLSQPAFAMPVTQPFTTAVQFAQCVYQWLFVKTHFIEALNQLSSHSPTSLTSANALIEHSYPMLSNVGQLFMTTTELTAVRLVTIFFSLPLFLLLGILGLIDGLTLRDLRRWGGGRESALIYHRAKRYVAPALLIGCFIYLILPIGLASFIVLLPFAITFAWLIRLTAKTFKKYV